MPDCSHVVVVVLGFYVPPTDKVIRRRDLGLKSHPKDCNVATLRERLRTHKVFTKDQCFYLNYHKFSIKSYVLDVY